MTTTTKTITPIDAIRANVPTELLDLAQWVAWKFEQRPGDKKPTKVLYNPATGARADSTEPRTWGTFDDAGRAYERGGYNGLGFVVTEHDPFTGVDLDGCIVNGELTDDANRWLLMLNSYTEITPSGVGVRVWIKAKKPGQRCKNAEKGVEIYETERFFTVTGNRLVDLPATINDRQTELEALYNEVFPAEDKDDDRTHFEPSVAVLSMDDRDLIERMCRKPGVQALWDGDTSGHANDHSGADLALCSELAYYTNKDSDRIDRLFRQSGLYRPKWERKDYRDRTITKAMDGTKGNYDPANYRSNGNNMGNPNGVIGNPTTFGTNGQHNTNGTTPAAGAGPAQSGATGQATTTPPPAGKPKPTTGNTANILQALDRAGYSFRMNELDDSIEVNGETINDGVASEIRCTMRDKGFSGMDAVKDAYTMNAYHNRYHPVKVFFNGLVWDGKDHIANLAAHFASDDTPIFYRDGSTKSVVHAFLTRFFVGAVGKVYEQAQNIVLTLAGPQGIGKSTVPAWLCSPLPGLFNENQLDPDGKETDRRLARTFLWEIGELSATTRRADVNALKNKLTQTHVTFRVPYGHYDVTKPVLTSFIGTVNPDGRGFLVDKTGNRRFAVVNIKSIKFDYFTQIDPAQVWAQAVALYRAGEPWRLTAEETATQKQINAEHEAEDTLDMLMYEIFYFDRTDDNIKMEPFRVAQELLFKNYAKDLDKCAKDAAAWLKAQNFVKKGKPPTWRGIRLRLPTDKAQNGEDDTP